MLVELGLYSSVKGGGNGQLIGSAVSEAMVRQPQLVGAKLYTSVALLQVVDN